MYKIEERILTDSNMKASELIEHLKSYIDITGGDCEMLSNVTNDSPDGIVVFKYGAFSLLAKNGRDFCVALTYLMSEKDSLNRFKVVGNKFDKEK